MKTFRLLILASALASTPAAWAQKVPVVEKQLSNGMKLLMVERHDEPSIAGGWVAHVGSANERPGITGIAHLFEHMMFKGTPTLGTKDYKQDLEIINEQERVRDEMRAEDAKLRAAYRRGEIEDPFKPENHTPRYKELEKEFTALIAKQRETMVKNEFDKVYTAVGGSGMNAFTSTDMTAYFISVPSNRLEFWMWMESERQLHPVFREFYAERDVVFEERRMRTESTPLGIYEEAFNAMFWESFPYSWPTLGWPSDIPAISKKQADEFYGIYYSPQNITLILIGDFKPDEATTMAEKYFGRIPHGKQNPPDIVTLEMKQTAEKRMYAEAETNPQVDIMWHTVPFGHRDSYALEVVSQLLSTRTGRLYKGLVLGSGVATDTFARQDSMKWEGLFDAGGEAKDGFKPEDVEQAIYKELERLKTDTVPEQELQKVKNNFAAAEYRKLSSNHAILFQVIENEGMGDWHELNDAGPKIQAVTADDIKRVATKYFTKENRAVGVYTRKAGGAPDDPELAGLDSEQKTAMKSIMDRLKKETNLEKLKGAVKALEAKASQVEEADKAFFKLYLKKVQDRVAELEKGGK